MREIVFFLTPNPLIPIYISTIKFLNTLLLKIKIIEEQRIK